MLHADIAPPGADRFVERVVGAGRSELLAVARAEAAHRLVVEQHLADRPQCRARRACRSSAGSGRRSCASIRACRRRNRAAPAPRRRPGRDRRCRRGSRTPPARAPCRCGCSHCCGKSSAAGRAGRGRPGASVSTAAVEQPARRHPLDQRVDRGQHDEPAGRGGCQPGQCVDPPADDFAVRRYPVVGQAVPGRKGQGLELGTKEGERRGEPRHPVVVAADMQPLAADQSADRGGVIPLGRAEQGDGARPLAERADKSESVHSRAPFRGRERTRSVSCGEVRCGTWPVEHLPYPDPLP